jgi:hypothetical protein
VPKTDGTDYEEGHANVLHWREYGVRQKNGGHRIGDGDHQVPKAGENN